MELKHKSLNESTHEVISSLGIKPSKSLGQNFLISDKARDRIVNAVRPDKGDTIFEIGGGLGALSIPIAEMGVDLTVYEIDDVLRVWLSKTLESISDKVCVMGDFLKNYQPDGLPDRGFKLAGNIPYQITSPILEIIYNQRRLPSTVTLMMQKEVAERLEASTHQKARGRITIWREYHATIEKSFDVKAGAFLPQPKVGSKVLHLVTKKTFPFDEEEKKQFFEFVKCAFSMKRKTFLNNIMKWNDEMNREMLITTMEEESISSKSRAEDLSLDDLVMVFKNLQKQKHYQ